MLHNKLNQGYATLHSLQHLYTLQLLAWMRMIKTCGLKRFQRCECLRNSKEIVVAWCDWFQRPSLLSAPWVRDRRPQLLGLVRAEWSRNSIITSTGTSYLATRTNHVMGSGVEVAVRLLPYGSTVRVEAHSFNIILAVAATPSMHP